MLLVALWRVGYHAAPVFEDKPRTPDKPRRVRDGPMVMMALPGGQFRMGSPDSDDMAFDNEKPQHPVTVAGFQIAVTPVTEGLYREVMAQEPPPDERQRMPVTDVSWYDAIQFCNALSERESYQPCYRQIRGQWVCDWHADGHRLPTEAEWEYACRAGTTTRYSFGDDPNMLDQYAWFAGNSENRLHEVRRQAPNSWGLYDMHGNVFEWCWDEYQPYTSNRRWHWLPRRRSRSVETRVIRGGSFVDPPGGLRSADRGGVRPGGWDADLGFRCVRVPPASFESLNH